MIKDNGRGGGGKGLSGEIPPIIAGNEHKLSFNYQ